MKKKRVISEVDFNSLIIERPETVIFHHGIEYVQNPFHSTKPLIAVDRNKRTAVETNYRSAEEVLWQL